MRALVIDNYDSFVYNLVDYFGALGVDLIVRLNDKLSFKEIEKIAPEFIVISPGPCTPKEAGISIPIIRKYGASVPIFGVCLGHQSIVEAYGGKIVRAEHIKHGKTSEIEHDGETIYKGVKNPFTATRYHSLIAEEGSLPPCLEISARSQDDNYIMGVRHKEYSVEGTQFHPESCLCEEGKKIVKNFIECYVR
jgi:anthranilate synthase/aminodeoxychorismate synthase-like glutamine amidotransferase